MNRFPTRVARFLKANRRALLAAMLLAPYLLGIAHQAGLPGIGHQASLPVHDHGHDHHGHDHHGHDHHGGDHDHGRDHEHNRGADHDHQHCALCVLFGTAALAAPSAALALAVRSVFGLYRPETLPAFSFAGLPGDPAPRAPPAFVR
jgi:hypothetical protein